MVIQLLNKKSGENIAFHPGYYLADIIEDSKISKEDFADRLGESPQTIRNLFRGWLPHPLFLIRNICS